MKKADETLKNARGGAVYEFAGFRLDIPKQMLLHRGEPIHLYARAFDALEMLIERREEMITKDELIARLWPDTVVEENSLARVISDLRKALGETGPSIVTVARRGYRFAAQVREGGSVSEKPALSPSRRALAVIPFSSLAGGDEDRLFAFGLADTLITRLSRLSDIAVRPTHAVMRYADQNAAATKAGRDLQADTVLTGTVRKSGDLVRVSVQLVDVDRESTLWADTFDEPVAGIFALEDSISKRVAEALALELTGGEERALSRRHTANARAHDAYLRGRYWLNRRAGDWKRQSVACFQSAVELDPAFALAHAGLAEAYLIGSIASAAMDPYPPREVVPSARKAAEHAVSIDPDLSEAQAILGHIAICFDWDWPEAERRFKRAISLNRNNGNTRQFYAMGLGSVGRTDEALRQVQLGRELEPTSMVIRANVGFILYRARRIAEAVEELQSCVALEPTFGYARFRYGLALQEAGRHAEAMAEFETLMSLPQAEVHGLVGKGHLLAVTGARNEARAVLARLRDLAQQRYVSSYYFAEICAGLGETDEAIAWLDKAYEERPVMMISLNTNPKFDGLHTDPRFKALEQRVGLWPTAG